MAEAYPIELENLPSGGRYFIRLADGVEAEMTFQKLGEGRIAIDHTYVPRAFRGNNLAQLLVERGIADARRDGLKVRPDCSFAAAQFCRHPEWADLLVGQ
jgi:hypothetical protein